MKNNTPLFVEDLKALIIAANEITTKEKDTNSEVMIAMTIEYIASLLLKRLGHVGECEGDCICSKIVEWHVTMDENVPSILQWFRKNLEVMTDRK